jgi:hypothetical protein
MINSTADSILITGTDIDRYRLMVLKRALGHEIMGARHSRFNAAQLIRGILGVKTRNRNQLYQKYVAYLLDRGFLVPAEL